MAAPIRRIADQQTLKGQKTSREAPDLYDAGRVRQCDTCDCDKVRGVRAARQARSGRSRVVRLVRCGHETCRLVRQARYDEVNGVEAQLNASMTLLTTKRVKKRRQQQPENLADWSKANRAVSIRAWNHSRLGRRRVGVGWIGSVTG